MPRQMAWALETASNVQEQAANLALSEFRFHVLRAGSVVRPFYLTDGARERFIQQGLSRPR